MHPYHLVYFSRRKLVVPDPTEDIFRVARRNNDRLGISGVLFVQEDYYIQLLEGPRDILFDRFRIILNDNRHSDVILTLFEELNFPMFSDWRMATLSEENPRVRQIYRSFTSDISSLRQLSGATMWGMIEKMASAVLRKELDESSV